MIRRNEKSHRHINILVPSRQDDMMLCAAVQSRFLELCASYVRIRGMELIPPSSLDADIMRWRQMAVRFRQGDFRRTEAEMKSLKTIAQWTVSENNKLRNQSDEVVKWKE